MMINNRETITSKTREVRKDFRSRVIMYVQEIQYLPKRLLGGLNVEKASKKQIANAINNFLSSNKQFDNCDFALIIHDCDIARDENGGAKIDNNGRPVLVKAHVHLVMSFKNPRSLRNVARIVGDDFQRFEAMGNKANAFAYLTHETKKAREAEKHRYERSEVVANFDFNGYLNKIQAGIRHSSKPMSEEKRKLEEVIRGILSGKIRQYMFFDKKHPEALFFFNKYSTEIMHAIETYNDFFLKDKQVTAYESNKNGVATPGVTNYFVTGSTGVGKSYFAREWAIRIAQNPLGYFNSGASNDPTQQYMQEPVAIFDDWRAKGFVFSDALKLLDPYGIGRDFASRYFNKLLQLDALMITTTKTFGNFPLDFKSSYGEDLNQFYRRFAFVVYVESIAPTADDDHWYVKANFWTVVRGQQQFVTADKMPISYFTNGGEKLANYHLEKLHSLIMPAPHDLDQKFAMEQFKQTIANAAKDNAGWKLVD